MFRTIHTTQDLNGSKKIRPGMYIASHRLEAYSGSHCRNALEPDIRSQAQTPSPG